MIIYLYEIVQKAEFLIWTQAGGGEWQLRHTHTVPTAVWTDFQPSGSKIWSKNKIDVEKNALRILAVFKQLESERHLYRFWIVWLGVVRTDKHTHTQAIIISIFA